MLLPNNIIPEYSIYFNGYIILKELKYKNKQMFFELYKNVKKRNDMSISTFILSLDWLYIINMAEMDEKGEIRICFWRN